MRINNIKKVKFILYLNATFLIITVIGIAFMFIINFHTLDKFLLYVRYVLIAILVFLTIRILTLKCFDYENSGEVVTIRYYHPFKIGRIDPCMEIPKNNLASFNIRKEKFFSRLCLTISGNRNKKIHLWYTLYGISKHQIKEIESSLKNV